MGGMDWMDLAQDTDTWRAVLNAAMKIRETFRIGEDLTASQKGFCFVD
jgi:hypothetical protein